MGRHGLAKAALESLVRYFAVALAKRGITVNAISPGWTEDSVLNTLPPQAQDLIRNWHVRGWTPMGRLGTPEDVGNVVTLFCSEQAAWITGQVIYADGGASLMNSEVPPKYNWDDCARKELATSRSLIATGKYSHVAAADGFGTRASLPRS